MTTMQTNKRSKRAHALNIDIVTVDFNWVKQKRKKTTTNKCMLLVLLVLFMLLVFFFDACVVFGACGS